MRRGSDEKREMALKQEWKKLSLLEDSNEIDTEFPREPGEPDRLRGIVYA